MRKKIFATLMSVAMVASFMPSIAFAANTNAGHSYLVYGTDYDIVNGEPVLKSGVTKIKAGDIDQYVKVVAEPTCTTNGSVELKCYVKVAGETVCDQTRTEVLPKGHSFDKNTSEAKTDMSLDEYANQLVAQNAMTDAEAKAWVKAKKNANECYVEAQRCSTCGVVSESGSTLKNHGTANEVANCTEKVQCSNSGCTAMILNSKKTGGHAYDSAKATTEKVACGGITVTKNTCTVCGYVNAVEGTGDTPNCTQFKGELAKDAVRVANGKYIYDGKVIAKLGGKAGVKEVAAGYHYDAANKVFIKADTTKTVSGAEKYGYTCTKCGYVSTFDNVAVAACTHDWVKKTVAATCTAPEQEYMVCSECGKYKKVTDTENTDLKNTKADAYTDVKGSKPLGHSLVVKTVAGDCHDTASYEITCSRKGCDAVMTVVNAATFKTKNVAKDGSLYINPTDALDGTKHFVPTTVNVVGSAELKYLSDNTVDNHKFTKKVTVKKASCANNEIVAYVCDTCGKYDIHKATIVPGTKLAHELVTVETPESCEWTAGKVERCKNCDYEKVLVKAKPIKGGKCLQDTWIVLKPATVFEDGIRVVGCSKCGCYDKDAVKAPIDKKTLGKTIVKLTSTKGKMTVKASADYATGYKVTYKRAGKKAVTKTYTAESISKAYRLLKGKKYTVTVTAFASNGTDTVEGAAVTKTITIKK